MAKKTIIVDEFHQSISAQTYHEGVQQMRDAVSEIHEKNDGIAAGRALRNEFNQADLDEALSDYRARLSAAGAFAAEWHDKLQGGMLPSPGEVSAFTTRSDQLNAEVARAFDHYSKTAAHYYHR